MLLYHLELTRGHHSNCEWEVGRKSCLSSRKNTSNTRNSHEQTQSL